MNVQKQHGIEENGSKLQSIITALDTIRMNLLNILHILIYLTSLIFFYYGNSFLKNW